MSKRVAEDDEWEIWRGEITSLYRKKSLNEVMETMEAQHGFRRK